MSHDDDLSSTLSTLVQTLPAEETAGEPSRTSLLLYHRDGAQLVPLREGQTLTVGRARPADVPIRDRSLSRSHARFTLVQGSLLVEDLESTNGTFVKGKRLRAGERRRAAEGDEVRLGAVTAVLHVLGSVDVPGGLESHDRVIERLEQEILRAQLFGRRVAALLVRAAERKRGHLSRWSQRVRQLLRPVDAIALYDATSALIVLAESGREEAQRLADAIVLGRRKGEPALLAGVAVFPDDAATCDELLAAAREAAQRSSERAPVSVAGAGAAREPHGPERPIILSPKMIELYRTAARVAEAASPVLILGETGTGKEVLASELHTRSKRRGPLRCLNCGAIPGQLLESALFGHERGAFTGATHQAKGIFEEAAGGTVLLDEIGELSPAAQAALLRVIETRKVARVGSSRELPVEVRVLAATHRDLEQMCSEGSFRSDLLFRLNAISLHLPPLRERREEILPLGEHFVREASRANHVRVSRIDEAAARLLQSYSWPGNIRELRNVIERAVLIAQDEVITVDDLSERIRRGAPTQAAVAGEVAAHAADGLSLKEKLRRYESELLLDALKANGWNQTRTAEALGMPLRTLVHKLQALGLRKRFEVDG